MRVVRATVRGAMILYHAFGLATFAALILAGVWSLLPKAWQNPPVAVWIALGPALYGSWLLLLLSLSALNIQLLNRLGLTWRKPSRLEIAPGAERSGHVIMVYAVVLRALMIWSLPGTRYLLGIPPYGKLLLYSYSHRVRVGRNCQIWGLLYDPDLTILGDGAVIGGDATLSAHSFTTRPDGSCVFLSAPIEVGPRAVIGANSRVALGATIGADSIVLPCSNVMPYTKILAGEVWGGDPARFVRRREEADGSESESAPRADGQMAPAPAILKLHGRGEDLAWQVRNIVASVLNLAVERISDDFCAEDCAAWDSLAQMAIAAAIFNHFGITVDSASTFCLRSVADLCEFVERRVDVKHPASKEETLPDNPEILPLLETATATRLLAQQPPYAEASHDHEIEVVIASTFTADQIAPALSLWCRAFGVKANARMLGFNQVQEALLDSHSPLRTNSGLNVVLTRPEDLVLSDEARTWERVESFWQALKQCAGDANGRLAVSLLPPVASDLHTFDPQLVARVRATWNSRVAEHAEIEAIDLSGAVERLGIANARSQSMELRARSPYSAFLYQELGKEAARLVRKRYRAPAKVIAIDADNTLWGGIVAEEGAAAMEIGADYPGRAFHLFQEALLKFRERGVLLVLVSRNEPEDVWAVFDNHPGMLLRRSHITAARINWAPKSQNLRELAAELNLGLDSFVFLDDDPANRHEVAANAPGVTVVPMPADPADYCRALSQLWVFDSATRVTSEDRERAAMMQREQQRQQLRESHADLSTYLRDLNLRVEMREATSFDLPRIAQLEQKTNQFNLALRRRTLDELKAQLRKSPVYVVQASDRFGDYGIVGTCIVKPWNHQLSTFLLDTLTLSCRSLGRGVEEAVLFGIVAVVREQGGNHLRAEYVPGPRNEPVRAFLLRNGFLPEAENLFVKELAGEECLPQHIEWITQRARLAG